MILLLAFGIRDRSRLDLEAKIYYTKEAQINSKTRMAIFSFSRQSLSISRLVIPYPSPRRSLLISCYDPVWFFKERNQWVRLCNMRNKSNWVMYTHYNAYTKLRSLVFLFRRAANLIINLENRILQLFFASRLFKIVSGEDLAIRTHLDFTVVSRYLWRLFVVGWKVFPYLPAETSNHDTVIIKFI